MNDEKEIITIEEFKELVPSEISIRKIKELCGDFAMKNHKKQCEDLVVGGKVQFYRIRYDVIEAEVVNGNNQNQNCPGIYSNWTEGQLKFQNLMEEE